MINQFKSNEPVDICREIVRVSQGYEIDGEHKIKSSCLLMMVSMVSMVSMASLLQDNLMSIEDESERMDVFNFVKDLTLDRMECVRERIFGEDRQGETIT
jgi:hypothetical protein